MTSGSQNTLSLGGLVQGALVDALEVLVDLEHGLEQHHGAASVQNLVFRLTKGSGSLVPTATFDEHAENVNTFLRGWESIVVNDIVNDIEVQVHGINGNLVLTGIILRATRQETVGKEELVDPEVVRNLGFGPSIEELKTLSEILNVAG